jgi:hypothetical protein
VYWSLHGGSGAEKRILFVCGAAKSGKTLLCDVLEQDIRVTVFREESAISGGDGNRLRFKPIPDVAAVFRRCATPMIVAEAKVESQNAASLLRAFPGSAVLWVWRDVAGAVAADLKRFKSQRENLLAILEGRALDWRGQNVSAATRQLVRARYAPDMPRADASALFWYARNVLWFEQGLDRSPAAMTISYEEFCRAPERVLTRIYRLSGMTPPRPNTAAQVRADKGGADVDIVLDAKTRALCAALAERLTACESRPAAEVPFPA